MFGIKEDIIIYEDTFFLTSSGAELSVESFI